LKENENHAPDDDQTRDKVGENIQQSISYLPWPFFSSMNYYTIETYLKFELRVEGLSMGMISGYQPNYRGPVGPNPADHITRTKVDELERRVDRLELENRALWELVRDAFKITDEELERRVAAIDLRDGVEDKKITSVPLRCPSCKRVASSRHWRCLYCGQEFEKHVY